MGRNIFSVLEKKGISIFCHLFCRHIIENLHPFDEFVRDRRIVFKSEFFYLIKNKIKMIDPRLFPIYQDPLRRDLIRRYPSADRAVITILVIAGHTFTP